MKTLNDVKNRLHELDAERKAVSFDLKAELTATRAELEALKEKRDNAESPDDYKSLSSDIKDKEAYIRFLEVRKERLDTPPLSKDECKEIKSVLDAELDTLIAKTAPTIEKGLPSLYKLMTAYFNACEDLNKIYREAMRLSGNNGYQCANIDRIGIADGAPDTVGAFYRFCANEYDREESEKLNELRRKSLRKIFASSTVQSHEYRPGIFMVGNLDE